MRSISPKESRSSTTARTPSGQGSASTPDAGARPTTAHGPPESSSGEVRIGAIDIGSNSIRAIVADVTPTGGIRVIDELKAAPRLGAGLETTGELSDTSMRAAIDALARMATLARQLGAARV